MSTTDNLTNFADDLDACGCLFGPLSTDSRARLFAAIDTPSEDAWDNAANIIINWGEGLSRTLWQCVLAVDPSYAEARGPATDADGNRISGWSQTPPASTIRDAIRLAARTSVAS